MPNVQACVPIPTQPSKLRYRLTDDGNVEMKDVNSNVLRLSKHSYATHEGKIFSVHPPGNSFSSLNVRILFNGI